MRFMVIEANSFVRKLCILFERDLLDLHYHLRYQVHRRSTDGIHWEPQAVRHVVCLILTHVSISFNKKLPGHFHNDIVKETLFLRDRKYIELDESLPENLKEDVNNQLLASERPATVSLKAIKMSDAMGIVDKDVPREKKRIRRRLCNKQPSTSNKASYAVPQPPISRLARTKPSLMRASGVTKPSIASRINYDNFVYRPTRLRSVIQESVSNGAANFDNNRVQPRNQTSDRSMYPLYYDTANRALSNVWTTSEDRCPNIIRQPTNMKLIYNADFWKSLSRNFSNDTTFFDNSFNQEC